MAFVDGFQYRVGRLARYVTLGMLPFNASFTSPVVERQQVDLLRVCYHYYGQTIKQQKRFRGDG